MRSRFLSAARRLSFIVECRLPHAPHSRQLSPQDVTYPVIDAVVGRLFDEIFVYWLYFALNGWSRARDT